MTPEAAKGWRKLCRRPFIPFFGYFFGVLVFQTMSLVLMLGKQPITSWHSIAPHGCLAAVWIVYVPRMWRMGPTSAATKLNDILTLPHLLASLTISVITSVGPDTWVPYHRRPLSMALVGIMLTFQSICANSGSVPTFHPPEPHTSMLVPYRNGAMDSLRVMDVLMEAFTIRMLLRQANGDCYWFGNPGKCFYFKLLAGVMISLLLLKFIKVMLFFFFKAWLEQGEPSHNRVRVLGHVASLACDLGISAVMLVNISTFSSNPPQASDSFSSAAEFRQELTLAVLSIASAILMFGVTVAGLANVLRGMRAAAARVSDRVSTRLTAMRSRASAAAGSTGGSIRVVPVDELPTGRVDSPVRQKKDSLNDSVYGHT